MNSVTKFYVIMAGFQASKAAAAMDHRDHPAAVAEELMVVVYTMTKKMTYTARNS